MIAEPVRLEPVKVLCITGWCRNGSTIIGNILNEIPGFFHVGELHFLWKNAAGLGANELCGCGTVLRQCPVWSGILQVAVPDGTFGRAEAEAIAGRQLRSVRTRHTWRILRHGPRSAAASEHAALMTRTYRAIAEQRSAQVIVDTSKMPGEAALLAHLPGVTPYYVHLIRDPRAVAHSWIQPKDYVYALSPARSTAYWTGFNLAVRAITRRQSRRSLMCRYEDFIADPAAVIDALIRLCGASPEANPVLGRTVELRGNHTVTGNPDRFRTGVTVIRDSDDAWRSGLPGPGRLAVAALAWPIAGRYGYRTGGAPGGHVKQGAGTWS